MQGSLFVLFTCFIVLCASQGPVCNGPNEKRECVSACPPERTCRNHLIKFNCASESTKICQLKCVCTGGYIRNDNGECIPESECEGLLHRKRSVKTGNKQCTRPNEFFDCGSACDNVCSELHLQNRTNCPIKNIVCNPKCYCRDGYARDTKEACVPVEKCSNPAIKQKREDPHPPDNTEVRPKPYFPPAKTCTGPHEYYECGPACDNVCSSLHRQNKTNCPIVNIMCNSKCYCKDGYARDKDWICVPVEKCNNPEFRPKRYVSPQTETKDLCSGPNEVYACKNTCPPETCMSILARYKCDFKEVCKPRCVCKPGYLREDDKSPCVPLCQCPQMKNSPDCINKS